LSREGLASRVWRKIGRGILKLLFKLWFGRRHGRARLERVNGLALLIPAEVFNPTLTIAGIPHPPALPSLI
jgi:hypothetical protein